METSQLYLYFLWLMIGSFAQPMNDLSLLLFSLFTMALNLVLGRAEMLFYISPNLHIFQKHSKC